MKKYKPKLYPLNLVLWLGFNGVAIWQMVRLFVRFVAVHPMYWSWWIFTALVIIYASVYMFCLVRAERLIMSADGIRHQTMSFTVCSTWDNVERIEKGPWGQKRLYLENPTFQKTKWARWDLSLLFVRPRDFIPIGAAYWEQYAEIEETLRKHAPGLFA